MFNKPGAGPTGMEMMLRNMGLGTVMDAALQLANSGAVEKIVQFADEAGGIDARLARIEQALGIEAAQDKQAIEGEAREVLTDGR